jgi:hypothetical protein
MIKYRGADDMTPKTSVRKLLMGAPYEEITAVAPTQDMSPLVPAPLDAPEPTMAMEEALIREMRRAEFLADAPVLLANDAAVRQAGFRDRFALPTKTAEADTRPRLRLEADAPVAPRSVPFHAITDQHLAAAEVVRQRSIRHDDQCMVPVMRKVAR